MKEKLLRVGLHTLEFLVVVGASALVVHHAPALGFAAMSSELMQVVTAGVLAALAKLFREVKGDYVNMAMGSGKKKKK